MTHTTRPNFAKLNSIPNLDVIHMSATLAKMMCAAWMFGFRMMFSFRNTNILGDVAYAQRG